MEHRLSCCSSTQPRRSAQGQGTLPNKALHLTTARAQKEGAVAGAANVRSPVIDRRCVFKADKTCSDGCFTRVRCTQRKRFYLADARAPPMRLMSPAKFNP